MQIAQAGGAHTVTHQFVSDMNCLKNESKIKKRVAAYYKPTGFL